MRPKKKPARQGPLFKKLTLAVLILRELAEIGYGSVDAFFPAKYPQAKMWRQILGLDKSYKFSKQTFHSILWRLQKQGLASRDTKGWSITNLGQKFIKKTKYAAQLFLQKEDGVPRLVIFDIPERERKKRIWLRLELINCGYKMLQKSVWLGHRPLPKEFFESLDYLNLRQFIHIISIKHKGTLENT